MRGDMQTRVPDQFPSRLPFFLACISLPASLVRADPKSCPGAGILATGEQQWSEARPIHHLALFEYGRVCGCRYARRLRAWGEFSLSCVTIHASVEG